MRIVNGQQIIDLAINANTWNVIVAGLNELPRKVSEPVVQDLFAQVNAQTQPKMKVPAHLEAAAKAASDAQDAKTADAPVVEEVPLDQAANG